ncbi:MAG: hypothetical protein NTU44_10165, partial [Bacteroidetes bacterium]|nr:hypothetical protein [Bacteroidota bacterium]
TPLLQYTLPGKPSRFFLSVEEADPDFTAAGLINQFSLIDYTSGIQEVACLQSGVPLVNYTKTTLFIDKSVDFVPPQILDDHFNSATAQQPYYYQLSGAFGTPPYRWDVLYSFDSASGS